MVRSRIASPIRKESFGRARRARRGLAMLALSVGLTGCAKACKNDRPYVPYKVGEETGPASAQADAGASPKEAKAKAARVEPALVAPSRAGSWAVAKGLVLTTPEGRELALALVRDLDGDGELDALAVTRPAATATGGTVDLVMFRGGRRADTFVVTSGPPLKEAGSCVPTARLEAVGPRSAFAELGVSCARGGSSRLAVVVRLTATPTLAFDVTVNDPPSAAKLTLEVDGADRDGDGIDDVAVRVGLEGGAPPFEPAGKVTGGIVFFDRPAGASRDPDEPEASLRTLAQQALTRAGRVKEASSVAPAVHQARALYRAICDEGGGPRLVKRSGAGAIGCGTSAALEEAGVAEVRAAVVLGDALRAVLAAQVAQLPPAKRTPARTTEIQQLLGQVAPLLSARSARVHTPSVPLDRQKPRHPEWGPLTFDGAGRVLVRGGGRVVAIDPLAGEETTSEVTAWPTPVLSPDGHARWLEAYVPCDGAALRASFAPEGAEGDAREVALPVAPPLGARCTGARSEPPPVVPLAWGPRGLEAIVQGNLLLFREGEATATLLASPLDQGGPPGSARSAGGATLALPTAAGVLVRGPSGKSARVTATELEPYSELRACVANEDGTRLACVKSGKVALAVVDR